MCEKRVSQKRSTCWGTSRSSATSLMVRNASGLLSIIRHRSGPGGARYSSSSGASPPLMRALRTLEGLNTMTRRGSIGTSTPVLGLRPTRCPFSRTTNDPNEDSFTVSPALRLSQMCASTSSTSDADSVRDSPTFWYTASLRSASVTVRPAIRLPLRSDRKTHTKSMPDNAIQSSSDGQSERGANLPAEDSLPAPVTLVQRCASPAQQRAAPGEAAADRLDHDEVALLHAAVAAGDVESQRDRCGRRVAVLIHSNHHL